MSKTTKCAVICAECGHKGLIACIATDQGFSCFRELYRLEGFFGLCLTLTSEADRPPNAVAALNPRCPKCKSDAVGYAKPRDSLERMRMTKRGVDFMHSWIDKHVTTGCRPAGADLLDMLARQCAADAASAGIALPEIEEEMRTDVRTLIFDALVNDLEDEYEAQVMGRRH